MKTRLDIRVRITCPNCWAESNPGDLEWVSSHPDLRGDAFLGDDAQKRFLPSRFDPEGFALDAKGMRCQTLACPACHLPVPRILIELTPLFISIIGAPSSGKSYFFASSIWETRKRLRAFHINFMDADPVANQIITDYEKKLFLSDRPEQFVAIPKTEEDGELYQMVDYGTRQELFARPFVFAMQPGPSHPVMTQRNDVRRVSRALCLYDNAGEHFQPKLESERSPATDHLALSEALIYVFDPLQHAGFRNQCRQISSDPQLHTDFQTFRQDVVIIEAAKRIRQKANLAQHERFDRPLIVVVNKYDVWRALMPKYDLQKIAPYRLANDGFMAINRSMIDEVSSEVRRILLENAPEVVAAVENFCDDVTFIPASPQGCSPELDQGLLGVRPNQISPIWSDVPLLYAISRAKCELVPVITRAAPAVTVEQDASVEEGKWPPNFFQGAG